MRLMGKKVPDKNIIGNVIMLPTTLAVSVLFVTVPTSIPSEQNIIGPRIKNGMSQTIRVMSVRMMCASNTKIPTAAMSKKEITDKKMYHNTFDANHSSLVSGVKDNCLNSLFFLYSEEMFTIENIGLISIENPMSPGTRKSMSFGCSEPRDAEYIPIMCVPL
jgi:hypothetical protein